MTTFRQQQFSGHPLNLVYMFGSYRDLTYKPGHLYIKISMFLTNFIFFRILRILNLRDKNLVNFPLVAVSGRLLVQLEQVLQH